MTATPNDGRQDVLRTAEDQCAQEGAIARAMQSNIDRAPHPLAAAPAVAPDEREAEHLPFAPEQRWAMWNEWDAAHPETTGEYDAFLGGLAAALAARPASVVSALPCHQGVRGCAEVGEHYHPSEIYAKDAAPVVSGARAITLPRPVVPHGPLHQAENEATANYLWEAARRIRDSRMFGSNLTRTVSDLLAAASHAVREDAPVDDGRPTAADAPAAEDEGGRE